MLRMHKLALKAVASLARIDVQTAAQTVRQNPILETEIHIDEELINLKETLDSYYAAGGTIRRYPSVRLHVLRERRDILRHCIGLIDRMLRGRKLPHSYSVKDIDRAIRHLVQLMIEDCRRTGRQIDQDLIEIFRPFMSVRQRVHFREWGIDMLVQLSQVGKIYDYGSGALKRVRS